MTSVKLLKIFLCALAIRWGYALVMYAIMGRAGLMGPDSTAFFALIEAYVNRLSGGNIEIWEWLGPHDQLMPLYSWLLTLSVLLAGPLSALCYILLQGAIDSGTCILIYLLANEISPRFALPAAFAAIVNPTQIVMSGLIYPDPPFVFFVTLSLYGSACWLRSPTWRHAFMVSAGVGAASLFRILIGPWIPIHLLILLGLVVLLHGFKLRYLMQLAAVGPIFCIFITPIVVRNVVHYESWSLTAQGGNHLAIWVVPLVKEAADGTPWVKTADEMLKKTSERYGPPPSNPFVYSRQQAELGREALWSLGLPAIAKAWMTGAAVNLASPAVVLVPAVAQLPRTGFYGTQADTLSGKILNFLFRSDNALYAQLLFAGIVGVLVFRLLQLYGLWITLTDKSNKAGLCLLAIWACYILAISGPIASPKYRLPIEPFLMVLAGAGLAGLNEKWKNRYRVAAKT